MSEQNTENIEELRRKTVSNLIWKFLERFGAQLISAVLSIVLARLLTPNDYGVVAIIVVLINILQVFVDGGLASALIQKKNSDDKDFSTVFYANIVLCLVLYVALFLCSPLFADFYGNSDLTPVVRVLGLTIIISGLRNVQQAYISKFLLFKKNFFATLWGVALSAVIGVVMAMRGFGYWALVAQQILNNLIGTIILWGVVRWRPKAVFSYGRFKNLFSYGWKLLTSNLINTVYDNIRTLVIGKIYSPADLAFYTKGGQIPNMFVQNINTSINSVLFPVMSNVQDDMGKVKSMTRRSIRVSSFVMWPLMLGLMGIGKLFIVCVLTSKWLPSLPFLYIFCFCFGLQPIQTANLNAIMAMGRSDIYLKLEIIKKILGLIIILVTMNISTLAMAIGVAVYTVIVSVVNSYPNYSLLKYNYFQQLGDIMPSFLLSAAMLILLFVIPDDGWPIYLALVTKIVLGIAFYSVMARLFKVEEYYYCIKLVKELLAKK